MYFILWTQTFSLIEYHFCFYVSSDVNSRKSLASSKKIVTQFPMVLLSSYFAWYFKGVFCHYFKLYSKGRRNKNLILFLWFFTFFLLTLCKAEQPRHGMDLLLEKQEQDKKDIGKLPWKNPTKEGAYYL